MPNIVSLRVSFLGTDPDPQQTTYRMMTMRRRMLTVVQWMLMLSLVQRSDGFGVFRQARRQPWDPTDTMTTATTSTALRVGDARGDYYGESAGSFMVKEFNMYDQLQEVVQLAAMPLPERPDGIVAIAKFTTASLDDCRTTEAEYERLARSNPSTLFLRCFAEYENADLLFGQAQVTVWPTFDIFYGGNRVARVEGPNHVEVEELLKCYQFQNSQLDLFSEVAPNPWGDGQRAKSDFSKTPRTTARFLPGYDWGSDRGFFDATADKMENDFMGMYETSWIPDPDDDGRKKK